MMYAYSPEYGMRYGYGVYGWPFMMFILGLLIWFVVWLVLRTSRGGDVGTHNPDPRAIAKERYAKGELTREEYERMKKELDK